MDMISPSGNLCGSLGHGGEWVTDVWGGGAVVLH